MSGVSKSQDWQDQLRDIGEVLGHRDDDSKDGYKPNRYTRRKSKKSQEQDPFEGVVFDAVLTVDNVLDGVISKSDSLNKAGMFPRGIEIGAVDSQLPGTGSDENSEEAAMIAKKQDPFASDEDENAQPRHSPKGTSNGSRKAAYDDDHEEEYGLSEEDQAELDRRHKTGERVKKGIVWTMLGFGTVAVVGGAIAIVSGLLGNHKSNIMNL